MRRTQRRGEGARQERRKAAEERNAAWRALSTAEKLAALPMGGAHKQRAKLAQARWRGQSQ